MRVQTEVVALKHFPFADKQRKPGDVITAEDWDRASEAVQSSLIAQDFVRIGGTSPKRRPQDRDEGADESEASSDVILLLQGQNAKLDRVLGILTRAHPELAEEIAEAVTAKPTRKKKAGK